MTYYIVEVINVSAEEWQEVLNTDDIDMAKTEAESLYLDGFNSRVIDNTGEIIDEW